MSEKKIIGYRVLGPKGVVCSWSGRLFSKEISHQEAYECAARNPTFRVVRIVAKPRAVRREFWMVCSLLNEVVTWTFYNQVEADRFVRTTNAPENYVAVHVREVRARK